MVTLTIDDTSVTVEDDATILDAAKAANISIPTLCYFKGLCDIGACRVCCVEVEGDERLSAACNTPATEGMVVRTRSDRAEAARKTNLELIRSRHDLDCRNCVRYGTCRLQYLLKSYGLAGPDATPAIYPQELPRGKRAEWDPHAIIQRNASRCIQCGRCVAACKKLQGIGVWEFIGTGSRSSIGVADNRTMREAGCVACGQCITHCPVGALSERDDIARLRAAIADPEVTTVVQIAPATRTAWASSFGKQDGELGVERMCAALKEMGVDYVFDTVFAADLTIMEEGTELLNIVKAGETDRLPLFTSCCPGWVNFARTRYPESIAQHLSSAKSPMQMFGAVVKTWFAEKNGLAPEKIFSVALMPCTAKKVEVALPGMSSNPGVPDMDASLTTREFARMIAQSDIDVEALEDVPLDDPLDKGTGAGVIFGATGGVMEAALRTAFKLVTGKNPGPDVFREVRGMKPWKEAEFNIGGAVVRAAVVHGLGNVRKLIAAVERGEAQYDFVEVMACPGGCVGGGGQPIHDGQEFAEKRAPVLYAIDKKKPIRFSHENPEVNRLYETYLEKPCSPKSHHLLHVEHKI